MVLKADVPGLVHETDAGGSSSTCAPKPTCAPPAGGWRAFSATSYAVLVQPMIGDGTEVTVGFFGGLHRKFTNEASLIEKSETCDGIAAGWAVR